MTEEVREDVLELNLEIYQGSSWDGFFFNVLDPNNDLMNFVGKDFFMHIRGCYSSPNEVLELSNLNDRIVLTHGNWKGDWDDAIGYVEDDIVRHIITKNFVDREVYFICVKPNTNEEPSLEDDEFWIPYKQVRLNLSAEETEELIPGIYFYDLEIYDNTYTPTVVNKLIFGRFIIKPESTKR